MSSVSEPREVTPRDEEFPDVLANAKPPVKRLWVRGADLRSLNPFISIVGSRRATAYGLDVARSFAARLASQGWCVVSGLAKGIDASAHQGALSVAGRTVAVLGSGIDVPYPSANAWLFDKIVQSGAVVSEYPPGTPPLKWQFPERNRIIAALGEGLVLVQAREKHRSGAMGTAALATEQGRVVFAVPGDVRAEVSIGPHALIHEGAAVFCHDPDVIGETLAPELARAIARASTDIPASLPVDQRLVLAEVRMEPGRADDIAMRAELDIITANRALARLEMAGFITRGAGGFYRAAR